MVTSTVFYVAWFFPSETFKGTTFENIITSSNVERMVEGKNLSRLWLMGRNSIPKHNAITTLGVISVSQMTNF